ncbi:UDP-N-acetylglucosamine--N-acetylmuramyl-(pentapeptide) pyrophosphoryl-undecaprenol N-acetylglucosamine transferase [Desulfonema limicola]|uniref:UDP-N-acetylglucosamine--N-acetylmuramyl-(pentapeptide) pyrophosphoryl-undecaprenol N-acetylglucosamine transferase n=1 Tax=Desulfonema limicola TaxID=45656 RepID=A0A975BAL9_9BACT|nr:undecaprenyldiphospho-muramoylpentapeptide beta-N-acetylglucosaminyltransferase [Desulfonema limicola]QTA82084.1 UDP-N-acetylglucosamine--N-acetylmuramyl-(pentapeptide) pyrophosphoryl-undecaprenol N-acetylglucosamine transferase [Desulfonema limicola]
MSRPVKIIIAGGGTGGHLFPGIAIADEFMAANPKNQVLFIGTDRTFEINALAKAGYMHQKITARGIKGLGIINGLKTMSMIPIGILEALDIIKSFKPDLVIGVGGYSSGTVVLAAILLGVKTAVHEQNSIPGITNRILSRLTNRVYISFADTKIRADKKKILLTGNPVRQEILRSVNREQGAENREKLFTVLIIGGSQGARSINMAVIKALSYIENIDKIHFIHQTGERDWEIVKNTYEKQNILCNVKSFFNNMALLYNQADLLICRSGATTIAEITGIGKPAVFIPFPFAADDHQTLNAQSLKKAGAADMINEKQLSPEKLAEKINYYMANPGALNKMSYNAKKQGRPDAAQAIIKDCHDLLTAN